MRFHRAPLLLGPLLLALWLATLPMSAAAQLTFASGAVRSGTLSFDGKATAGDFVGTTHTLSGEVMGGPLDSVRGWVSAPVTSLKTGNDRRDRDLNKSMESARYPDIRFDLSGVSAAGQAPAGQASADSVPVTLHGTLHIHGVDRTVDLPATVLRQTHATRVRTDFPLNLKDYRIGGLSKMLGLVKMEPDIVVHVDVTFGH